MNKNNPTLKNAQKLRREQQKSITGGSINRPLITAANGMRMVAAESGHAEIVFAHKIFNLLFQAGFLYLVLCSSSVF